MAPGSSRSTWISLISIRPEPPHHIIRSAARVPRLRHLVSPKTHSAARTATCEPRHCAGAFALFGCQRTGGLSSRKSAPENVAIRKREIGAGQEAKRGGRVAIGEDRIPRYRHPPYSSRCFFCRAYEVLEFGPGGWEKPQVFPAKYAGNTWPRLTPCLER